MATYKTDICAMKYRGFKKLMDSSAQEISLEVFRENRESVDIKKEKTALKNYGKIFDAVFRISYRKGFHAMSLRDLSADTGLSMGALYRYFSSKEELLSIILMQGQSMLRRAMEELVPADGDPATQLRAAVKTHLFLSEAAREWFYFAFMEARNLGDDAIVKVISMEAYTEKLLVSILRSGETTGVFRKRNHIMTASIIKAMQQDWYLKRWKYSRRKISVDEYAETVMEFVESYCMATVKMQRKSSK